MSINNSQAAIAREVKLAVGELARTLNNCFRDASSGLSDQREMTPNLEAPGSHGLGS